MKKKCFYLQIMIMVAMLGVGFVSCGDDDDETGDTPLPTTEIEAVDLGLSVKWANMNVGANSPESIGGYYAWGEVSVKNAYTRDNYQSPGMSSIGGTEYDAAKAVMGVEWRMPTEKEMKELLANCTFETVVVNGHTCGKFTASNGNSILLPTGGWKNQTISSGDNGAYWVSTGSGMKGLLFVGSFKQVYDNFSPEAGMLVRAVME